MKKINFIYALIPMIFVSVMTIWAMFDNLVAFLHDKNYTFVVLSVLIIILTFWLLADGIQIISERKSWHLKSLE